VEESKDFKRLDELFEKARLSKPVMDAEEIRNLISTAPFATLDNTNPQKSNKNLYLLLAGVMFVAVVGSIWFMSTQNPSAIEKSTEIAASSQIIQSQENTTLPSDEKAENKIDSSIADKLPNSGESVDTKVDANVTADISKNEVAHVAPSPAPVVVKEKPVEKTVTEPVAVNASNKTSIVRGSDMEVKITDAGKDITMKVKQDYTVDNLTINGSEIAKTDYKKYTNYIDQGIKIARDDRNDKPETTIVSSKSAEDQKRDELNTKLFNTFSEQLKKDKLINADKFSFKLTTSEMQIDGKTLPASVQKKYLDLFKTTAGRELGGTTFKFEHGLK
jgi:hypothetical protein